jgi:hypothetical protein
MSVLVTVNGIGGPKVLCLIDESEINQVIEMVVKELKHDYGEEEVTFKNLPITEEVTNAFPTIFKTVEVSCKSSVDTYKLWIEFHKQSLKDLDLRKLRKIIM